MALRYLLGRVNQTILHARLIKPKFGLCGPVNNNALNHGCSSSCFVHLLESYSTSDSTSKQPPPPPPPCGGTCFYKGSQKDDWIISLAQFAIDTHNSIENKNLEFVRVIGASHTTVSSIMYHVTLEAIDTKKHKIFHAIVWMQLLKQLREVLVWKPVDDCLSAVGVKGGDLKLHEAVMSLMSQANRNHLLI